MDLFSQHRKNLDTEKEKLRYTPILRLRPEEKKVLTTFDFGNQIYPLIEIINEFEKKPARIVTEKIITQKRLKRFDEIYLPVIRTINSVKVFVDLPVHMSDNRKVKPEVLEFLKRVVANRVERTNYLKKLKSTSDRMIPVISTYSQRTNELNSIVIQEKDLRDEFKILAFRTFPKTIKADMIQIEKIARSVDYLMVDLDTYSADPADEDIADVLEILKSFKKCHIIILKSAIDSALTNVSLEHGKIIARANNELLRNYRLIHGHSFGDYAGIKKDGVTKGFGLSPGFIYFEPCKNIYFGFKGNAQKENSEKFKEYARTIVPAVINSEATKEMQASGLPYLSAENKGWQILNMINGGKFSGKSPRLFKRISIEHYLHCIRTKIENGDFIISSDK